MKELKLGSRLVGPGHPPYVIAEVGSNHNGDMDLCRRLVETAARCGADAVKFQSWDKSSLIGKAEYARNTQYADKKRHFGSLEAMVERYQFTPEQHAVVAGWCRDLGIHFLSSAFSPREVDMLEGIGVVCHKVASMDVNNLRLLECFGKTGKPVLLSTGMATLGEIEQAITVLDGAGAGSVALLHCISVYPPDYRDIHLRNLATLATAFDRVVGFSDHTIGTAIPLASVALGACIIEKHFTLDKGLEGWDHWISADPDELAVIVHEGRNIVLSLGSSVRTVSEAESRRRPMMRRRILVARPMKKGEVVSEADLDFKRPGTGIAPDESRYVVGRRLARDVDVDHELEWTDLQ
jgi:N-acetylneuraminate synthase